MKFPGTLNELLDWARRAGQLRGQRSRGTERILREMRNMVAHPIGYSRDSPVTAARLLADIREIINQLWGSATPGGRLYPAPVRREVFALAWQVDEPGELHIGAIEELAQPLAAETDPFLYAIVLTAPQDDRQRGSELTVFDSRYELTSMPTSLLWGPGSRAEAAAWLDRAQPSPDVCDYLDRLFAIRHDGARVFLPMRPEVAAALPASDRGGVWYLIEADKPTDAFALARMKALGAKCRDDSGGCRDCRARQIASGSFAETIKQYEGGPLPPDINIGGGILDVLRRRWHDIV